MESCVCKVNIVGDLSEEIALHPINTSITKLEFNNCESFNDAENIFKSSSFEEQLQELNKVFVLRIKVQEFEDNFVVKELNCIESFKNKSVVVRLSSKCTEKFLICWKSKEFDFFLVIKPHTFYEKDETFYEILSDLLAESLLNNHLGLIDSYLISNANNNVDVFNICDHRSYNLLFYAAEKGNIDLCLRLCKLGLDTDHANLSTNAQEVALDNGHFDLVMEFFKVNLTLPESVNVVNSPDEFKVFIEKLQEFHNLIVEDNFKEVIKVFQDLPRTDYCYNLVNESALKVATKNWAFNCYDFFLSEGLRFAPHERPEDYYEELEHDDKRLVRQIHEKYTQELQEKHINVLLSKSLLSHDVPDSREKFKFVQQAYEALSANVLIKIVLMVVAASKNFKIIFDFNRDAVNVADPTTTSSTQGIFYLSGKIYIGAKQLLDETTAHETLAVMAHELCHFAMNLVFQNKANPYKADDTKTMSQFQEIADKCEENGDHEEVIGSVFDLYPDEVQHAEIIVRVVHLLALYRNQFEKLDEIRKTFCCLFEFYETKIMPEMKLALVDFEGKPEREIQKKISNLKRLSIFLAIFFVLGALGAILTVIFLYEPVYKFNELSVADKIKIQQALVNYKNVKIPFQSLFAQNSLAYENLTSDHIANMLNGKRLDFSDPHVFYLDEQVKLNWTNMPEKLKEKFLNLNLTFQNKSMKFEKLKEKCPKAFEFLESEQIIKVLDGEELIIGKMISSKTFEIERKFKDNSLNAIHWNFLVYSHYNFKWHESSSEEIFRKYYKDFISQNESLYESTINEILRNKLFTNKFNNLFKSFENETIYITLEKIVKRVEKFKIFILSSDAGTGKTATFEQFTITIKRKFPTRWVSYIDLKDHTELYKNESLGNILSLVEKILGLNSKNIFERKVFEELYKAGEVVLLWNGFDEISPTYSDFILNVLNSIYNNEKTMQFLCTRPLYNKIITDKFGFVYYELVPLDREKQQEFIGKYFISSNHSIEKIEKDMERVEKILKTLSEKPITEKQGKAKSSPEDFNTPLMLEMISDLIANNVDLKESENLWIIYEKFLSIKINIWKTKGEYASKFTEDLLIMYRNFNMISLYQMYALKFEISYLASNVNEFNNLKIMQQKIPKQLSNAEISRMGILYINGEDSFSFAHKTFSEFFVAQFLIENIYIGTNIYDKEEANILISLFFNVLNAHKISQVVITRFLQSYFQTQTDGYNDQFNMLITENLIAEKESFHELIFNKEIEIIELLLTFFKKDYKFFVDFLNVNSNVTLYTKFFHNFHIDTLKCSKLVKLSRKSLKTTDYKIFIQGRYQKGIILYGLYRSFRSDTVNEVNRTLFHDIYNLSDDILLNYDNYYAFALITEYLDDFEILELFKLNSISDEIYKSYLEMRERFSSITKISLTFLQKKNITKEIFDESVALNNDFYLASLFLVKLKNNFSESEIFEILSLTRFMHRFPCENWGNEIVRSFYFKNQNEIAGPRLLDCRR